MKIKDIPKIERPREKLLKYGPKKLTNAELLAIILGKGKKGENVIELAKKILRKISSDSFLNLQLRHLENISGVGEVKATQIIAVIELGKRLIGKKESTQIITPKDIWSELKEIRSKGKEYFVAFYLDMRNQVIKREIVSIGTLNASLVHPREVFEPAVKHLAAQIILSHNHPSGEAEPSDEDVELTKRLIEAGKILGIEIIDHVIVTDKDYLSLKEKGIIQRLHDF
ncbi:DNA repair protein RadC [Candidatus Roizmanbacteria bacterium]|nr:DNA repair protein RadC [Candidatus Roizmanbacteria bacterium]